jgi:hypothetical protein
MISLNFTSTSLLEGASCSSSSSIVTWGWIAAELLHSWLMTSLNWAYLATVLVAIILKQQLLHLLFSLLTLNYTIIALISPCEIILRGFVFFDNHCVLLHFLALRI